MRRGSPPPATRHRGRRRVAVGVAAAALVILPAAPVFAHGAGDSTQSRVLVLDALTYLANRPAGYEDMVSDKIGDALEAPDQEGVNLDKVASAQKAFEGGNPGQARTLLQQSVQPLTEPVTGEETGTTVMLDPAEPTVHLSGLDGVLAALSAAAVAGGLVMAIRTRPTESVGDLKERLNGGAS